MLDPRRIWSSSQLPTLPGVAAKLLELTKDPETEIRQVIDAISTDPAISAKILKAANSSFFGLASEVRTIDRAVPLLGTTVATSLALSFSLTDDATASGPVMEHYKAYWRQSIVQGCAAELLAVRQGLRSQTGEFFLCGLLLDLGRLAMLKTIPRDYVQLLKSSAIQSMSLTECELASFGFTHVEIGAKLMENWKIPQAMIEAVRQSHASYDEILASRSEPLFSILSASNAASAVGDYFCAPTKGEALERLRKFTSQEWQMSESDLEQFLQEVDDRFKLAGELFKVDMSQIGAPSDLMVEANEQLAQLALREHLASTKAAARQQSVEAEMRVLESKNVQLQEQALHDPLTKLYNRRFFDESLTKEMYRCMRAATPVGIIFGDVDHFKKLNDTYGHQAGDEVLKRVAELLRETGRNSDTIARFGGEEFVILVGQPTEKGLEKFAERIRDRIASEPFVFEGQNIHVTISLGAALMVPGRLAKDGQKDLLAAADACLYESKQNGRNRVTVRSMIPAEERQLIMQVSQQRFSRWLASRNLLDIPTLSRILIDCPPENMKIGELAARHHLLSAEQIDSILDAQKTNEGRFGEIACQRGWLSSHQLSVLLAWQQENPKKLAAELIKQGLLRPEVVAAALEEYLKVALPQPSLAR